jgi:hypothetical protein
MQESKNAARVRQRNENRAARAKAAAAACEAIEKRDAELIAIVVRHPGETPEATLARIEEGLRTKFAAMSLAETREFRVRLEFPRRHDRFSLVFSLLPVDVKVRLILFLRGARKRERAGGK